MIGSFPKRPSGNDPEAVFMRWVMDSILELRPVQTPQTAVNRTTRGVSILNLPVIAAAPAPVSPARMFKITAFNGGASFTARTWDGTTLGTTDIVIAKPFEQRTSHGSEAADGVTFTLSYPPTTTDANGATLRDNNRTSVGGGRPPESQVVYPRYKISQIVWAMQPTGGTLISNVTWCEFPGSRVWVKRYV
jgi:hypothetical protein